MCDGKGKGMLVKDKLSVLVIVEVCVQWSVCTVKVWSVCTVKVCVQWRYVCSAEVCAVEVCVQWRCVCSGGVYSGGVCTVEVCVQWRYV